MIPFHGFGSIVKAHALSFSCSALSWFGVIVANQTLDVWLQRASWVFAICASTVAIWVALRKDRRESHK